MAYDPNRVRSYDINYLLGALLTSSLMELTSTQPLTADVTPTEIQDDGVVGDPFVYFIFAPGRTNSIKLYQDEALTGPYVTIPSDTGSPDNYSVGPFLWSTAPKFLQADSSTSVVVTVARLG